MNDQTQVIKFKGTIISPEKFKEKVFVKVKYDKLDVTNLDIELSIIANEKRCHEVSSGVSKANDIVIENDWEPGTFLKLHDIFGASYSASELKISANSISYGIKRHCLSLDEKVFVTAKFTPGGLLVKPSSRTFYPDGNIKIEGRSYKDSYWETEIGTFNVSGAYEYFSDRTYEREMTTLVNATHAHIEIKPGLFSNLEDAFEKVYEKLLLVNSALSLAFRVPVMFYEIEFLIQKNDRINNNSIFPLFKRFKLQKNQKRYHDTTLMHSTNLTGKKFHHLTTALQNDNLSNALTKTIQFLSLSRDQTLENGYFYCFLALDYIIDEVLKKNGIRTSIPDRPWKKIRRNLKGCIQSNEEGGGIYSSEIIKKIPELKRYSFTTKVLDASKVLRLNTKGLWERKTFEEGIKEAAMIRNKLFHKGHVDSYDAMFENLMRLQFLIERIVLRIIKWKPSQCWALNDNDLKRINQG